MDKSVSQALSALKQSKTSGLTFYQAKQHLLQQGFSKATIDEAADQINYTAEAETTVQEVAAKPLPTENETPANYQRLGNAILEDKERSSRPYAYSGVIFTGALSGYYLAKLYVNWRYCPLGVHSAQATSAGCGWAKHEGVIFGGIFGGILLLVLLLKFTYWLKDRRYRKIDRDIISEG